MYAVLGLRPAGPRVGRPSDQRRLLGSSRLDALASPVATLHPTPPASRCRTAGWRMEGVATTFTVANCRSPGPVGILLEEALAP